MEFIPTQSIGDAGLASPFSSQSPSDSLVAQAYDRANAVTARLTVYRNRALLSSNGQVAAGSGVVVSPSGEVATDLHVVENADHINVHLNGKTYPGHIVDQDAASDLALVQIEGNPGQNFQYADLAPSSKMQPNQTVEAYGYPDGLPHENHQLYFSPAKFDQQTPLLGLGQILGGLMPGENPLRPILQVKGMAIAGNSGGPLFEVANNRLQMVGLVDMSDSQQTIDATPVEDVRTMLQQTQNNVYHARPETLVAGNKPYYSPRGDAGAAQNLPFSGLNFEALSPNAVPRATAPSEDQNNIGDINKELQRLRQLFDEI
jgi:S1-C subfamily serine protease